MTAAVNDTRPEHPRTRPMASWRARKAVLASRGEVDGPRVEEANAALTWWRHRTYLIREMNFSPERADDLLDQIDGGADDARAEAQTEAHAEAQTEPEARTEAEAVWA